MNVMHKFLFVSIAAVFCCGGVALAQESPTPAPAPRYSIDLSHVDTTVETGLHRMGGKNPQGTEITATSRYLTFDGKPWFPIMGEFHFARYPRAEWGDELLKMKAGGINVVATYVFWIYHEEEEGKWDWSGDRDLRAFVQLCQKHGLLVYPRFGPWAHGEVRNGGFPDWLLQRCGKNVRKDAEPYLGYARGFYAQIGKQLDGLLWKDGGPAIGTQLENELTNNPAHLLTLKRLARELGIDVPLYTATGWMRARVPEDEVLPVFGGYPDAFWSRNSTDWARESRVNYFFNPNRDDSTIGADLAKTGTGAANDAAARTPYGTVELGGGMQVSYRRRPVIEANDVAALALAKLGSGSNMQGYYMYHGGANKLGKLSALNESRATGYPNEMPVINYDFQAPLGEYGQRRESYDALRVQHLFLHDYGAALAPLPMTLPDQRPTGTDDRDTLRWSVRSDGEQGFLFINNYQRIEGLPAHDKVQFAVKLKNGDTRKIPVDPIRIPAQTYMIWPMNLDVGGVKLDYATAQPLCRVGDVTVFFAVDGVEPEFAWGETRVKNLRPGTNCLFSLDPEKPDKGKVLLLTQSQARQAYKAHLWGEDRLFLSQAGLIFDGDAALRLQSRDPQALAVAIYPPVRGLAQAEGHGDSGADGVFETFRAQAPTPPRRIAVEWSQTRPAAAPAAPVKLDDKNAPLQPNDADFEQRAGVWQVRLPKDVLTGVHRAFLRVDYAGDAGRAYVGDQLIDDDFYFGRVWEIGLNRFAPDALEKGIALKILPLRKDAPIYIPKERLPPFDERGESALDVRAIEAQEECEVTLRPLVE